MRGQFLIDVFVISIIISANTPSHVSAACQTNLTLPDPPSVVGFEFPTSPYVVNGYAFAVPVPNHGGVRHLGEDINLSPKDPVKAVADGNIIWSCTGVANYGQVVIVEHKLQDGTFVTSIYGHLSKRSTLPLRGPGYVGKGEIIGYVGYPNENGEDGPHLHFGIRKGKHPGSTWVYHGRSGSGQDVDVDLLGRIVGGAFTKPSVFITDHMIPDSLTTEATLDGSPWSGPVNYSIIGPQGVLIGLSVPATTSNLPPGQYTMINTGGGPPNTSLVGVSPSQSQTLVAAAITFTLRFVTNGTPRRAFFDGGDSRFQNVSFGEPLIDNRGNLVTVSTYSSFSCGFGFCGIRLNSISPTGSLNWQAPTGGGYVPTSVLAAKTLLLGSQDRVYVEGQSTLYAYDSSGMEVPGWPVAIAPASGNWLFPDMAATIDRVDGTIYAKVGVNSGGAPFPATVVALFPSGAEKWRKDFPSGNVPFGLVQGPARDIYTPQGGGIIGLVGTSIIGLDHGTGNQFCQIPLTAFYGSFVGGLQATFTSYQSDITAYDANCTARNIFTSTRGNVELRTFDTTSGRIFGIEYPTSPVDPNQIRLFSVTQFGTGLWRDSRVIVSGLGNPIRAINNGVLYVLGQDTTDGNKPKLFLMDASSGAILNAVETTTLCSRCGVAVSSSGTVYLNDLDSARIYKLN